MAEIIVTGAAGFIGSYVAAALLDRGEQVLGIDSLNAYYDPSLKEARLRRLDGRNGFRFIKVDIADEPALKAALADVLPKTRHIIHLAAQAGVRYSIQHPEEYVRANLNGHFNMLQMARQAPQLEHLVYASSSSVYGASKKVPFSLDDAADHPVSLYAATKRADELLSVSYARKGMFAEALRTIKKGIEVAPQRTELIGDLAYVQALAGDTANARRTLHLAKAQPREPFTIARAYIALQEPDSAFVWLDRSSWLWPHRAALVDPALDPIRSDPRFTRLAERIDREMGLR